MNKLRHEFIGVPDEGYGPETHEVWRNEDGEYHREDGPAVIHRDVSQAIFREEWYFEGKLHRKDGPAVIEQRDWYRSEEWYKHGRRHRYNEPALLLRSFPSGVLMEEEYYQEDREHRMDGPSRTERNSETGVIEYQSWKREGVLHRTDGPAEIDRDSHTGEILEERYFIHGKPVNFSSTYVIPTPIYH